MMRDKLDTLNIYIYIYVQTGKPKQKINGKLRDRGFAPLSSEWGSDKLTTTPTTLLVFFGSRKGRERVF